LGGKKKSKEGEENKSNMRLIRNEEKENMDKRKLLGRGRPT